MLEHSRDLERLVEHIHSLIEQEDVEVIWNNQIPDPDNPGQLRQIDVLLRRDCLVTHIECRLHNQKQNVTWVEELIGRRESLGADSIIAVSAAGFTEGAKKKATAHGIALRDLCELSDKEIASWGKRLKLSIKWLHFENLALTFLLDREPLTAVSTNDVFEVVCNSGSLYSILESVKKNLDPTILERQKTRLKVLVGVNLSVGENTIQSVEATMDAWLTEETLNVPSVVAYGSPTEAAVDRQVTIGTAKKQRLRVCRSSDAISVMLDMSQICPPEGAMLFRFGIKADRPVTFKSIQLLGQKLPEITLKDVVVELRVIGED